MRNLIQHYHSDWDLFIPITDDMVTRLAVYSSPVRTMTDNELSEKFEELGIKGVRDLNKDVLETVGLGHLDLNYALSIMQGDVYPLTYRDYKTIKNDLNLTDLQYKSLYKDIKFVGQLTQSYLDTLLPDRNNSAFLTQYEIVCFEEICAGARRYGSFGFTSVFDETFGLQKAFDGISNHLDDIVKHVDLNDEKVKNSITKFFKENKNFVILQQICLNNIFNTEEECIK